MSTALQRAVELLADPPPNPDISKGYLDLLGGAETADTPKNTGLIQAAWASPVGSMLYDRAQLLARRMMTAFQHPIEWLQLPRGGTALDVGSGPGNVTASLARAAGPGGLALGVDISQPMLARAVRAEAGPQVGFVRADAQRLPFRDESFDAVVSIAMLQLIPKPPAALAEMVRMLRPGARMAVMVPTAGRAGALMRLLPDGGAHFFTDDEIGDALEDLGLVGVRTKNLGTIQWVRGRRP
ncbi:methyltransferase domain-containing protein [Mycobacterium sp. NPDC048908]|uniref:methyltransferase domain-containing protein n=1 Tax=Mycobacterium sp. NPDC048908 TaxID=3364292 RepID=UPI00371C17C4